MCEYVIEDGMNCNLPPKFGLDGVPMRCWAHRKTVDGLERLSSLKCPCGSKTSNVVYGYKYGVSVACSKCREPGMVNVNKKRCITDGCVGLADYASAEFPDIKRYCGKCKPQKSVSKRSDLCIFTSVDGRKCEVRARYAHIINGKLQKPQYCVNHAPEDAINVADQLCDDCRKNNVDKFAVFNLPGEKRGLKCVEHKLDGMVDVKNKKCAGKGGGCTTQPRFNTPGSSVAKYCVNCKEDDMIDIYKDKCRAIVDGKQCNIVSSYGNVGEKPQYCALHKKSDMILIRATKCKAKDCEKQANFGERGTTKALWCLNHKDPSDVNVRAQYCDECDTYATFGFIGLKPTKCGQHAEKNMIVNPIQRCKVGDCKKIATFQLKGKRTHCEKHAKDNEISLLGNCVKCGLENIVNMIGVCDICDTFKKVRHAKEHTIKTLLDKNNVVYQSHDKLVDMGECVKYRPDFLMWGEGWIVILEVDENQHKSYMEYCECTRMINIHQALGGVPMIFIRYNPDKYDGNKMKVADRHKLLLETINYYLVNCPKDQLSYLRLFFDRFKRNELNPVEINYQ